MPLTFCGIDPGVTGAVAFLDTATPGVIVVYDMPELAAYLLANAHHVTTEELPYEIAGRWSDPQSSSSATT